MSKHDLRIDWATHDAAKHACERWHYSKCLPVGKLVKLGAWEVGRFVGVVVFGRGATPNLGKPYGLGQPECVELVRVALRDHQTPVSRIVAVAVRFLRSRNPGIRLIVSFADSSQGHHGGIYQAGNWIYAGRSGTATFYEINGKLTHPRSIGAAGHVQNIRGAKKMDPKAKAVSVPGKYRYLMPLDNEIKSKVLPLAMPYPKRAESVGSDTPAVQAGKGGAIPTSALHMRDAV